MDAKRRFSLLASCVLFASALLPAAHPAVSSEHGLRGLRRVELVFLNVGRGGIAGGIVPADGVMPPTPANEDLSTRVLSKDRDCLSVAPTLAREGLDVVERCRADDLACGKLYLTVEDHSSGGGQDRIYLIGVELTQRARLARDPTVELSMPTTWSMHRVAAVAPDHSATTTSCMRLHDMAAMFVTDWKEANR